MTASEIRFCFVWCNGDNSWGDVGVRFNAIGVSFFVGKGGDPTLSDDLGGFLKKGTKKS